MAAGKVTGYSRGLIGSSGLSIVCVVLILVFVCPSESIRFLGERETYARYPKWNACINASISFDFRTTLKDGLLMFTADRGQHDYLQFV
ncbi:Neurexin-1b [Bulinus truncatus]|nr:Neurexin-1b [Bulinus truncatus]